MALTGEYEPSASGWVREHVEQIMRTGTTDGVTINGLPTVLAGQLGRAVLDLVLVFAVTQVSTLLGSDREPGGLARAVVGSSPSTGCGSVRR